MELVKLKGLWSARRSAGLSLRRLADLSGVTYPTIHRIEHGGETKPETARKLAKALGVTVEDLEYDEADKMRRQAELLEWRLRQYESREEQSDVRWSNLHGIAAFLQDKTRDEDLRARLERVAEIALKQWSDLFDWEQELEEVEREGVA